MTTSIQIAKMMNESKTLRFSFPKLNRVQLEKRFKYFRRVQQLILDVTNHDDSHARKLASEANQPLVLLAYIDHLVEMSQTNHRLNLTELRYITTILGLMLTQEQRQEFNNTPEDAPFGKIIHLPVSQCANNYFSEIRKLTFDRDCDNNLYERLIAQIYVVLTAEQRVALSKAFAVLDYQTQTISMVFQKT